VGTRSLEALMQVGAAEAGIPQVLLAAVELMAGSFGSDNELAQASRYTHISPDVPSCTTDVLFNSFWERVFPEG
jgi:hypothetical protein